MHQVDYYAILGVMPNAEDVVIFAAYRALAQRYHPDKWQGAPEDAHQKMVSINEAYSILKNPERRAEYDKSRKNDGYADFSNGNSNDQDEAFNYALSEVEEKWKLACLVFPDLQDYRKMLARTSTALAFAFVMNMIETKDYNYREAIAKNMEDTFLKRYFGSNDEIIKFAKNLIRYGHRDAAKKLNKIIDVMGEAVESSLIISVIQNEFNIYTFDGEDIYSKNKKDNVQRLKSVLKKDKLYSQALELVDLMNFSVVEELSSGDILLKTPHKQTFRFDSKKNFINWVIYNIV